MKRGDPVTERGVWLRAVVWDYGPEQTVVHMEDAILYGINKEHVACTKDLIPWAEYQKDRGESYLKNNKWAGPSGRSASGEFDSRPAHQNDAPTIPPQRSKFVHECECGNIFGSGDKLNEHKLNCGTLKGWYA